MHIQRISMYQEVVKWNLCADSPMKIAYNIHTHGRTHTMLADKDRI